MPGQHEQRGEPHQPVQRGTRDAARDGPAPGADEPAQRPAPDSRAALRLRLERLPYGHPSSPYHVDGELKPPPPRLRHLELAPPAPPLPLPLPRQAPAPATAGATETAQRSPLTRRPRRR